ncbi:MAG: hypothetical protein MUQ65_13860, partial [Armatimonadetes bacterium]|nr:hypothetical protein [Armatimonadota bacterium]
LPGDLRARLFRSEEAAAAAAQDIRTAVVRDRDVEIRLHYLGGPVLKPGLARPVRVGCRRAGREVEPSCVTVSAPDGWQVRSLEGEVGRVEVEPPNFEGIESLRVTVMIEGEAYQASFAALSPSEARGFPSAVNIEYCPTCDGRKGSCICAG